MFAEITLIHPDTHLEFMVHFNLQTKKVSDVYTFIKDWKEVKDEDVEDISIENVRWKAGKNPLFGHNKNALKKLSKYLVAMPKDEREWMFLHDARKVNDLVFEILEP